QPQGHLAGGQEGGLPERSVLRPLADFDRHVAGGDGDLAGAVDVRPAVTAEQQVAADVLVDAVGELGGASERRAVGPGSGGDAEGDGSRPAGCRVVDPDVNILQCHDGAGLSRAWRITSSGFVSRTVIDGSGGIDSFVVRPK